MRNLKKLGLLILSLLTAGCTFTACLSVDPPYSSDESHSSEESTLQDSSSLPDESSSSENSSEDSSSSDDVIPDIDEEQTAIVDEAYALGVGDYLSGTYTLTGVITEVETEYSSYYENITVIITVAGRETKPIMCYRLQGDGADVIGVGYTITVTGRIKNYQGIIEFDKDCELVSYSFNGEVPDRGEDPYENMTASEFYANYSPSANNEDAYYRSLHCFLSGELRVPDQAPTVSSYQPKKNGKFIRNSEMQLSADGKTYTVVDAYGNEAFKVYKDGAYITLEEVAAYVYAFGTYPKNHTTSKNADPSESDWGEYLRLNHTEFSGDTDRYPYEPVLPNISGCGGTLHYYEMDIGTTGTDCDPAYDTVIYNDGYTITRGAARIVYGKDDLDGDGVYEIGEFHVFYTYNHYNDFQEYLNYEGGWGEMFGNITGGGTISSRDDYNPTDYVSVYLEPLPAATATLRIDLDCCERKKLLNATAGPVYFVV